MPNGPVDSAGVPVNGSYATAATDVLISRVAGDAFDRYVLNADGSFEAGDGAAAAAPAGFAGATNTRFGRSALQANTAGVRNVAFGQSSLLQNLADDNSAFGANALQNNVSGIQNLAMGSNALQSNVGSFNTGIGSNALQSNTSGIRNVGLGNNCLFTPGGNTANATTTGSRQTAVGVESGQNSATQRNDIVCVGYHALVDGDFAISIGSGVLAGAAGAVAIGTDSGGVAASTTVANEIKLGSASHTLNVIGSASLGGVGKTVGLYGATPVVRAAAITAPTAPGTIYSQAEAQSAVTAINAIRTALANIGVTL